MRVLFLINYVSVEGDPMGVMQLSAIAKSKGWETDLCLASENYMKVVKETKPDLIAVSMMTTDYLSLMHVIRSIRTADDHTPILVGGPHPTYSPELIEEPEITAICVGEGDYAFMEVLDRLEHGESLDEAPNIHTKNCKAPVQRLIEDLDSLRAKLR